MNIKIEEYSVSPSTVVAGTQGSEGMSCLSFSFDESWDDLAKKVLFVLSDGTKIYKSCREDAVVLPRELMHMRGKSRCYVIGRCGKRRLVSLPVEVLVLHTPVDDCEEEKA